MDLRARNDHSGFQVLAAPLRKTLVTPIFLLGCLSVLLTGGLVQFVVLHQPANLPGVAALGALFGGAVAINDTSLAIDGNAIYIQNPLRTYRIPISDIHQIDTTAGLFIHTSTSQIKVSAVPTGLAGALSRRQTRKRVSLASDLAAAVQTREPTAHFDHRTTGINWLLLGHAASFAGVFAAMSWLLSLAGRGGLIF